MSLALPRVPENTLGRMWWMLVQVPWRGLALYLPQVLLALPAAYASSQFAAHYDIFPWPFNIMIGVGFEYVYCGTLAVAGAQDRNRWYVIVNGLAVITSIIYVTLHAADKYGLFGSPDAGMLWVFAFFHGVPLAGLNFSYGLLIHTHLKEVVKEMKQIQFKCPYDCGHPGFPTVDAMNGHKGRCPKKP